MGASNRGMKHSIIDIIAHLNRSLADDFRVMPLFVPDAPIFMAVAWPTADHVTGLKPRLPAGRGTTLAQAMRSAGAEAIELRASLAQNHLAAMAALPRLGGRAMVSARDLLTGDRTVVPAQLVYLDFAHVAGEPPYADANSTGCATGLTEADAIMAALLECLERDAMALWWHGGLPPAALALDLIDGLQPRLFWWLQERARQTRLLDLSTDTSVAVVAAISFDADGHAIATGTAARLTIAEAALSAVTEMLQTEAAMAQAAAMGDPDYQTWRDQASTLTMAQFQARGRKSAPLAVDFLEILRILAALGLRALAVNLTLAADPQPTYRVVIPGICAMHGQIDVPRFTRLTGRAVPDILTPEPF